MITLNDNRITPTIFPDNTSQVWKILPLPGGNRVVWTFEHEAEFMHLAQLRMLLPNDTSLTLPYLPYARQDKDIANDQTFALWPFSKLLNALNFARVYIFDPHNYERTESYINGAIIQTPWNEISKAIELAKPDLLCFPDEGAVKRYRWLNPLQRVVGSKVRDQLTGKITGMSVQGSYASKHILIVDDLCDGGATFIGLANAMHGAAEINLYVSHGIFSRGTEVLRQAGIKRIFTKQGEVQ